MALVVQMMSKGVNTHEMVSDGTNQHIRDNFLGKVKPIRRPQPRPFIIHDQPPHPRPPRYPSILLSLHNIVYEYTKGKMQNRSCHTHRRRVCQDRAAYRKGRSGGHRTCADADEVVERPAFFE